MRIPELLNLVYELIDNTELTKKEKNSLAANIKKQYGITVKDFRTAGKEITTINLRRLIYPLIKNYDSIKDINSINEVIQTMTEDFDTSYAIYEGDKKNLDKEKEKIYAVILGNPGTSIDGMSNEYISKIIKRKLTEKDGINRDDIMNVLNMQGKNMYLDLEGYQKLINDSVVSYLTYNENGKKFSNPKIMEVFKSLAASYKVQGNFDKVKEIYEQALKMKSLENTTEYSELVDDYDNFIKFMDEMKAGFVNVKFDCFEDLLKSLNVTYTQNPIFVKKQSGIERNGSSETVSHDNYVMPVEYKLKGLEKLNRTLKREDDSYEMKNAEIGQDAYEGYAIIKIENANVSILENFNEVNARIFIVKNEMIDQIRLLTKNDAIALEGVEAANHVENFNNYCNNLIRKTIRLINETKKGVDHSSYDEVFFDEDEIYETDEKNSNVYKNDGTKAKEMNVRENNEIDEVELERMNARKNRDEVKRLEKILKDIQKNTDEKINNVLNSNEHSHE